MVTGSRKWNRNAASPGSRQVNDNHFSGHFSQQRLGISKEPRGAVRVPPTTSGWTSCLLFNRQHQQEQLFSPSFNLPSFCLGIPFPTLCSPTPISNCSIPVPEEKEKKKKLEKHSPPFIFKSTLATPMVTCLTLSSNLIYRNMYILLESMYAYVYRWIEI